MGLSDNMQLYNMWLPSCKIFDPIHFLLLTKHSISEIDVVFVSKNKRGSNSKWYDIRKEIGSKLGGDID
jgi:hypothetical protein